MKTHSSTQLFLYCSGGEHSVKSVRPALEMEASKEERRPGGPVVILLSSGSEVGGFDPGRGRWIFSERKNPKDDFLRKGSKAVGPVS